MQGRWVHMLLVLGLFLPIVAMWSTQQHYTNIPPDDWTRKEVGAIIHMTIEFVKDMDMKMRDVRRIEKYYYGTHDFGAGRIFSEIESKFEHMVTLYKNSSYILRIMSESIDLRSDVVGSLQFMLSDYMEFLSLVEMFKERFSYWRANSELARIKDIIRRYLLRHNEKPYNYEMEEDPWRRFASRHKPSVVAKPLLIDDDDDTFDYIGFNAWYARLMED